MAVVFGFLLITMLSPLASAGPGGARIFSGRTTPAIRCEYLLSNRMRLLDSVFYVHNALTKYEYRLVIPLAQKTPLKQYLHLDLDPIEVQRFQNFKLKITESATGYRANILNSVNNSKSTYTFDMPPLYGQHRLDVSAIELDTYLRKARINANEVGNNMEAEFGEPEDKFLVYLKRNGELTNLYLSLEPTYSSQVFLGIKLPCSKRMAQGFVRPTKVKTAEGWFCYHDLLNFELVMNQNG